LTCTLHPGPPPRRVDSQGAQRARDIGYWVVLCTGGRYGRYLPIAGARGSASAAGCWRLAAGAGGAADFSAWCASFEAGAAAHKAVAVAASAASHNLNLTPWCPHSHSPHSSHPSHYSLLAPPSTRQQRFRASCQNASSSAAAGTFPLLAAGGPPIAAPVSPPNPANHTASTALLSARNAPAPSGLAPFLSCRRHQHGTAAPQHRSTALHHCPLLNTTVAASCRIVGPFKLGFILA
jgi:hypothetical protein